MGWWGNKYYFHFVIFTKNYLQGGGGCSLRDNVGDPGRARLQLLCPWRRHHNDCGWNGHLQHCQECRPIQGDWEGTKLFSLSILFWTKLLQLKMTNCFSGVQKDPRSVYYQPSGKVEQKFRLRCWPWSLDIRMLLLSKEHLQVGNQEYQVSISKTAFRRI